MSIDVILNENEIYVASLVGLRRRVASMNYSKKGNYVRRDAWWDMDIEGANAELAVAKHFGIYWDFSVGTFKAPDVGSFQVRHTHYGNGRLVVRPADSDTERYYLVTGAAPIFTIHGWLLGKDAKQDKYLEAPHGNAPCWMVPNDCLNNLEGDLHNVPF